MKRRSFQLLAALSLLSLSLSACRQDNTAQVSATATPRQNQSTHSQNIKKAIANVKPTQNSTVQGTVTFTQTDGGVRVVADFKGLTPGEHGFHVHEKGDCSAHDASSAGGHYNPTNKKHGGPDSAERHVGDLGNVVADQQGFAHYERVDNVIQLNGEYSIVGKSIVIHEKADDYITQPTGDSGARLGCGVIEAQN